MFGFCFENAAFHVMSDDVFHEDFDSLAGFGADEKDWKAASLTPFSDFRICFDVFQFAFVTDNECDYV